MKHIKKKLLDDVKRDLDTPEFQVYKNDPELLKKKISQHKGDVVILETESGKQIASFVHIVNNIELILPIPDPTLVYFNNAHQNIRALNISKEKLIGKVQLNNLNEPAILEIYEYFGTTS